MDKDVVAIAPVVRVEYSAMVLYFPSSPTNDILELCDCYADSSGAEDKIITLIEIYVE